ncbi:hypothetical protein RB195_001811 [Necator americanus]|uniref:Uncharacterized protein n=1 Tax=Necator americanus TaxID=51031 RepID=A0ABR1DIW7_NECAM
MAVGIDVRPSRTAAVDGAGGTIWQQEEAMSNAAAIPLRVPEKKKTNSARENTVTQEFQEHNTSPMPRPGYTAPITHDEQQIEKHNGGESIGHSHFKAERCLRKTGELCVTDCWAYKPLREFAM